MRRERERSREKKSKPLFQEDPDGLASLFKKFTLREGLDDDEISDIPFKEYKNEFDSLNDHYKELFREYD